MSLYTSFKKRISNWTGRESLFKSAGTVPEDLPSLECVGGPLPDMSSSGFTVQVYRSIDETLDHMIPRLINIPEDLMIKSGLRDNVATSETVYLVTRSRFRQQVNFIRDFVVRSMKIGLIYGQPGTGKSSATLYTAVQMVREQGWTVLWAHVSSGSLHCLHLKSDGYMEKACISVSKFEDLLNGFARDSTHSMTIVDGLTKDDEYRLASTAMHWVKGDRETRRLIIVSSQGKYRRLNGQRRSENLERIFIQWSWTEEEYEAAMRDADFAESVKDFMDAPPEYALETDPPWKAKHYFAGGSARFMFSMTTEEVIEAIEDAVEELIISVSNGTFDMGSVNGLVSVFANQRLEIVSQFAEKTLLEKMGSKEIVKLAQHPLLGKCDSTRGTLFELFVRKKAIEKRVLTLERLNDAAINLTIDGEVEYHVPSLTATNCPCGKLVWPRNRREPTIDALMITLTEPNQLRLGKFFQVTVSESHDVDMEVLRRLKQQLGVDLVEFYSVVPNEILTIFKPGIIKNKQAMSEFGWPIEAAEIKNRMHVVGVDGWIS